MSEAIDIGADLESAAAAVARANECMSKATMLVLRLGDENGALKSLAAAQLEVLDSARERFAQLAEEMRSLPERERQRLNFAVCLLSRTLFGSITPPRPAAAKASPSVSAKRSDGES